MNDLDANLNKIQRAAGEAAKEQPLRPEGETWQRVIVVSNRLPFKIVSNAEGKPSMLASSGGLVTAMSPLLREGVAGKWVGWLGGQGEEGLEEALRSKSSGLFEVGAVSLTKEEEKQYYEGYSNQILSPLLVGEVDRMDPAKANEFWPVYRRVQKKFAKKIREDAGPHDIVWIQDYHLMGVGKELREMNVHQPVGYFLHTAFPSKEEFMRLPQHTELLEDLLSYDIVGFQTNTFKQHFIETVHAALPEAVIETAGDSITLIQYQGNVTRLGSFPISIDTEEFKRQLESGDTKRNIERLERVFKKNGVQMIFNIGRLDYTKGFYEELRAFDRLLEQHPELVGKVVLYQLVVPSRESIDDYREYKDLITDLAKKINAKYKTAIVEDAVSEEEYTTYAGRPVRQVHTSMGRSRYIAHVNQADIQSIPTLSDGMNLVAKESAVVGNATTVQILGEAAGAAEELGDYVLLVEPQDTQAFADRLYQAYTMAENEKRDRKGKMAASVTENDVFAWWSRAQEPTFQKVWNEKTDPTTQVQAP